jgi:hypothetical protein
MMDSSENDGTRRLPTRPFVGGRPIERPEPTSAAYTPARPFSFSGARTTTRTTTGAGLTTTTSMAMDPRSATPTPRWSVAVYEPGLERTLPAEAPEAPVFVPQPSARPANTVDDIVEASIALHEDVIEAGRHASSAAAAEMLELVARKLRRGEILLLPGASTSTDTGAVSAVLAALLGGRR